MSNVLSLYETGVQQLIDAVINLETLRLGTKTDMQGNATITATPPRPVSIISEAGAQLFDLKTYKH